MLKRTFVFALTMTTGFAIAQSPAFSQTSELTKTITVTGRVERLAMSRDTGTTKFILKNSEFGTGGAIEPSRTPAPVYRLDGDPAVLLKHLGHTVTLSGTAPATWSFFDDSRTSTDAPKLKVERVDKCFSTGR